MSGVVVLDDALLLLWLAERFSLGDNEEVATSASWWFRLARAVVRGGGGRLSRELDTLPTVEREAVHARVLDLPWDVVVPQVRMSIPVAARLSAAHNLNLLAADALATAQLLDGRILVASHGEGPRLRAVAVALGVQYEKADA